MSATSIEKIQSNYQFQYQNESKSHQQIGQNYENHEKHHRRSQSFPTTIHIVNTIDSPVISIGINKSNNLESLIKLKSTMLVRDVNNRINTNLTSESESDLGQCNNSNSSSSASNERDTFLWNGNCNTSRRNRTSLTSSHGKNNSVCYRINSFITRNWYLSYIVPLTILIALMFIAYLTRDYAKMLLFWIENQNSWVIFTVFIILFIVVSFPVAVGYFVLMITSGYLFGFLKGFIIVVFGANMGIAVAHHTIRSCRHRIPIHKLIKNETARAILRVISGPKAFKVVLFTRLTPIPFGLQNAIFGISSINSRIYHTATFIGLLPAQSINVYLGSTLRSMHEVLNNHGTALTGYITFGVEVVCGVALMLWVIQKARTELSETLLSDISADGKIIDIQV